MSAISGIAHSKGNVNLRVYKANNSQNAFQFLWKAIKEGNPFASELTKEIKNWRRKNFSHLLSGSIKIFLAKLFRVPHFTGELYLSVLKKDGTKINYGLASTRMVTTAGVNFIVDAFQNSVELENMKFHGIGLNTGDPIEAVGDTALTTELTTQYNPNSTRATGTTIEGASANIYRTVATNTLDEAAAIKEHGIFTQAAAGGGVLLDRSVFAVINLGNGDGLESTYDLTFSSGG